jgi:hypothetical protein
MKSMRKGCLQEFREKCEWGMIVQGWKQNPETSVNKLLFAGSTHFRRFVWGCPGLRSDVDLVIGHTG